MTPPAIPWPDPARREHFDPWWRDVAATWQLDPGTLRLASADASFRRYLRADGRPGGRAPSAIVMDAPPPQEDVRPFLHVGRLLADAGVRVPEVLAHDETSGFLLLGDLGDRLLLRELASASDAGDARRCDRLMREAISTLVRMQSRARADTLPPYDEALLRRELQLFPDWCVEREHDMRWTDTLQALWRPVADVLVAHALAQPAVFVHRDYMPRNLMLLDDEGPSLGVLDFQDAVRGPVTYDPVCLLRDAFIGWDEEREIDWAIRYWDQARKAGLPVDGDFGGFWRALEWTGMQRHLKVLGIFCRLKHRDGKPAYSAELPRFFRYVHRVATRYREFAPLVRLIEPLMGEQRLDAYY
jgi:N-acetylmuramate 1-kinase